MGQNEIKSYVKRVDFLRSFQEDYQFSRFTPRQRQSVGSSELRSSGKSYHPSAGEATACYAGAKGATSDAKAPTPPKPAPIPVPTLPRRHRDRDPGAAKQPERSEFKRLNCLAPQKMTGLIGLRRFPAAPNSVRIEAHCLGASVVAGAGRPPPRLRVPTAMVGRARTGLDSSRWL